MNTIDKLNASIKEYWDKWSNLAKASQTPILFDQLKPTALAWKVADTAELDELFMKLKNHCDQIHWGWVNDRWLVTMHLKASELTRDIPIIKLMQRRPGSSDAIGLDHLDFLGSEDQIQQITQDKSLKWTKETNGSHCKWISLWFGNTEAKLRTDTVLSPCITELQEVEANITAFVTN